MRRTRLQAALIAQVPEGVIKLRKRLASLNNIDEGGARLVFEDGEEVVADLVIGGDGIRSVCFLSSFVLVANLCNRWSGKVFSLTMLFNSPVSILVLSLRFTTNPLANRQDNLASNNSQVSHC